MCTEFHACGKNVLLDAFSRTIGRREKRAAQRSMETVLAFGAKRLPNVAMEDEFRLYARLCLAIKGFIRSAPENVDNLKNTFNTNRYGDVLFAKKEFLKCKMIPWLLPHEHPLVIDDVGEVSLKTNMQEADVHDYINNAVVLARNVIKNVISKLEVFDVQVSPIYYQWFGNLDTKNIVLNNYKDILARLTNPVAIKITFTDADVYGSTIPGSNFIDLGKSFYDGNRVNQTSRMARNYVLTPGKIQWIDRYTELMESSISLEILMNACKGEDINVVDAVEASAGYRILVSSEKRSKQKIIDDDWKILTSIGVNNLVTGRQAAVVIQAESNRINGQIDQLVGGENPTTENEITPYGTIIHELSHMVSNTLDHGIKACNVKTRGDSNVMDR